MTTNDLQYTYRLALTYFTFRIALAVILAAVSFTDFQLGLSGHYHSKEFIVSVAVYFILGLFTQLYALSQNRPPGNIALLSGIITDVVFCLTCMHFAGGFGTGLASLLLSPVAIAGIFFYGIFAFFIAAISSLGVLAHIFWFSLSHPEQTQYFVPAGLLGILFFASSLTTQLIARHIRKTEIRSDEQQDLAEKLAQTNQLIVQKMQTGLLVLDKQQCIRTINNSANQLLGKHYKVGDILNGRLHTLFTQWQEDPECTLPSFQEMPGLPNVRASFAPVQSDNHHNDTIIFLENQSALAQQAQHIKLASLGRLSASIAHEIRNPLSTINHASQLLAESQQINGADKRLLQMIENQAGRLNNIVNNVLSISRRTPANPQKVDLHSMLTRIIQQLEETRNIQVEADIQLNPSLFVVAFDESQLQQVLFNLIDNAVVHSARKMNVYWVGIYGESRQETPYISIYDKGPGIATEDVEKVFEPFYTTHPQGTGLGLYICRELCEMNQAVLDYLYDKQQTGFFQIRFAHTDRRLTINE